LRVHPYLAHAVLFVYTIYSRSLMKIAIVIPVQDEADNVEPLLDEIAALCLGTECAGVIFVDDSADTETQLAVMHWRSRNSTLQVGGIHRVESVGGLSGAVLEGLYSAQRMSDVTHVIVMDGDGQHPPASIVDIVAGLESGADLVATTRYAKGGSREGLDGPMRYAVSLGSTLAAKGLFPMKLRGISDPMTGFFGLRLDAIDLTKLGQADGFKILLELLVTHGNISVEEVPVLFRSRLEGSSKGTVSRGSEYAVQLWRLRRQSLRS
jgi:dolichol-phosphate mannosyltransferase